VRSLGLRGCLLQGDLLLLLHKFLGSFLLRLAGLFGLLVHLPLTFGHEHLAKLLLFLLQILLQLIFFFLFICLSQGTLLFSSRLLFRLDFFF